MSENTNNYNEQQTVEYIAPADNLFGRIAFILGMTSVFTTFLVPVFPVILGGIAIILAAISKGKNKHYSRSARFSFITGIFPLAVYVFSIALVIWLVATDNPVKQQVNETFEQELGQSVQDFLIDSMDGSFDLEYKIDPEKLARSRY